jgi:hypothetical protein
MAISLEISFIKLIYMGITMENIKIAVDLTDEIHGKKGIRIECGAQNIFDEIYTILVNIQPKIIEDEIFRTSKRVIVNSSYINDLEKTARELTKIDNVKYGSFFTATLNVKNKIYSDEKNASHHFRLR